MSDCWQWRCAPADNAMMAPADNGAMAPAEKPMGGGK